MPAKRKAAEFGSSLPQKRSRRDVPEIAEAASNVLLDEGCVSDTSIYSEHEVTEFKADGAKRADSEARRQWNYICNFEGCGQRFNRPCRLETHMRTHTKERPFACNHNGCNKTFPRKDHLQRHLKTAHPDTVIEREFICDWDGCGKSFTSNGRLQRHKDVHESKFYCTGYPPCIERFRKEKTLEAHIKAHHLNVKPYSCNYVDEESGERCTKGYDTDSALRRHISSTHKKVQDDSDRHCCMICIPPGTDYEVIRAENGVMVSIPREPLSFATREELQTHSREHHPPTCSRCGVKFANGQNLKSHFESVHAHPEEQPRFPCPQPDCNKVFNRQHNLTVHIQCVHEQKARFFCTSDCLQDSKHPDLANWDGENACGAAFKAKSSLDQHIRTHHLELPNRKATRNKAKASKAAPKPSMLTLLTGIGYEKDRPVLCLVHDCEHRFFMDRDLRRHLRATHKWTDELIEEKILEREAIAGGQFWIGGFKDPVFDSVESSIPQTPVPYHVDGAMPMQQTWNGDVQKAIDPQLQTGAFSLDNFDWSMPMFGAVEADLDREMRLDGFANVDVHDDSMLEFLAPVEQYNG
ncbi:hypothetical protein K504DRAFT_467436 [Pleomassaria siparia CBS 279.74]|uniref:C2H2-type domain-containing protein n=1 Tax=Pleomassaria siparia CBS 279.74 TaxID=1314801 RepID=A0A6G1KAI1_9PLEO|nr:hypothetical protein K504DRAFT_467436 [Pleomassaria siparia CBS 279.74]